MGDNTASTNTATNSAEDPATPETGKENRWTPPASQADLDRIIADRLLRERAKYADYAELKDKAAQFDEAQEAAKSEAQKQAEALAAAEERVAEYERREQVSKWVSQVAEATGIPADALRGDTLEEIEQHAEQLKRLGVGQQQVDPLVNVIPTIGTTPEPPGNVTIDQQIAAAEKAGQFALVGQLKAMKLAALSGSNT